MRRLESALLEVEAATEPVVVIAHAAPCRALRAYFLDSDVTAALAAPRAGDALADAAAGVVVLRPRFGAGWDERVHELPPAAKRPASALELPAETDRDLAFAASRALST